MLSYIYVKIWPTHIDRVLAINNIYVHKSWFKSNLKIDIVVNTLQTILIKIDYMRKCECNLNIGERQNINDEVQGVSKNIRKM